MMSLRNVECLGKLARPGAEPANIFCFTALFHQRQAAARFQRANQNEPSPLSPFDQQVQHPVNAVIEINVNRSGLVPLDERARARASKRVASFVVQGQIRLRFHDNARAFSPDQLGPDKLPRADQRVALEKGAR
jgi:hypothetical protein